MGREIDTIKTFDAESQRSKENVDEHSAMDDKGEDHRGTQAEQSIKK